MEVNQKLITEDFLVYFIWGFISAAISFLYYEAIISKNKNNLSILSVVYGFILSGLVGGLLAVVFDRTIGLSIIVGFTHQILYTSIVKTAQGGQFFSVVKEILIKYLTAGKG